MKLIPILILNLNFFLLYIFEILLKNGKKIVLIKKRKEGVKKWKY